MKIQTEVDGNGGEGKGIHRNWMPTAITSIRVISMTSIV